MKAGCGRIPPICYPDPNNRIVGFAVDVLNEAARREDMQISFSRLRGGTEADLESGAIDLLPANMITAERLRKFYVSEPWWSEELSLVTRAGNAPVKRMGVEPVYSELARNHFDPATFISAPDAAAATKAVCSGALDGALITHGELHDLLLNRPKECDGVTLISTDTDIDLQLAIICRKSNESLARRLRSRIDDLALDGTLMRLARKNPPIPTSGAEQLEKRLRDRFTKSLWIVSASLAGFFLLWLAYDRQLHLNRIRRSEAELRRAETRLRLKHEVARLGTFEWSIPENRFVCSPELEHLYGLDPGTFGGKFEDWKELINAEDWQQVKGAIERALADKSSALDYDFRVRGPGGEVRWLHGRSLFVYSGAGEPQWMIGVNIDITEQKRGEESLKTAIDDLEHFAYIASHDLQEPLRMVSLCSELLARKYANGDGEARQFVDFILQGAERMRGLISAVKIYTGVLRQEANRAYVVDLEELVHGLLAKFDGRMRQAGAAAACGELPRLKVDRPQIALVFENLIANALVYRSPERPLRIRIAAEQRATAWTFTVEDNGIGFDMAYSERIFEPFKRLHAAHEYPGSGIGLAMCKRIVERHGGAIWAESRPGEGSTFHFTIANAEEDIQMLANSATLST